MNEKVSALMDDALEDDDLLAAVDALASEPQLQEAWSLYHLAGEALRAMPPPAVEVTAAVMAALDEAHADAAPQEAPGSGAKVRKPLPL